MILLFKPFKVGDYIEGGGQGGSVKEISIFHTIMTTADNKRIIIPNASLSNGSITNFSAEATRRVDFLFGIGYGDDIRKAKEILLDLAHADSRVLKDPAPFVAVKEYGDNSVNIVVRLWTESGDHWPVYWDMMENVKIHFDENGITFPYPQRDVHLFQEHSAR